MKILVKSDVYDICNRIKKFDASYHIVFDNLSSRFEVYSSKLGQSVELISGKVLSYICALPYNQLDERSIKYLYDTSVDNIENILDMIDKQNQKLERHNEQQFKNQSLQIFEKRLRQST